MSAKPEPQGGAKLLIDLGPLLVFFLVNFFAPVPTFMAFNVWFIIWPNQKKVLGIVAADDAAKAKAAATAGMASRLNVLLSIPMLLAMTNAH